MWIAIMVWACAGKGGDSPCEGATCAEPEDDACAEVDGREFSSSGMSDFRLGDVVFRSCRDMSPGDVPILKPYGGVAVGGSVIVGSFVRWEVSEGEDREYRGMVSHTPLRATGGEVRAWETEVASRWALGDDLFLWAGVTGDIVDVDGNGQVDLIVGEGGMDPGYFFLPGFVDSPSEGVDFLPLPFRVYEIGDITGDAIPDIARFLTDGDGDDVLAVQAMPVEGELADQPWDIVLGGVVRYDWIDLEDRFVGGGWDHNADGINDMAVGAFTLTEDKGQVYLYDGPITEARTTDEADATLARFDSRCGADGTYRGCDQVGTYTKSAGDLDGDGYTDIAIASRGSYVDDMMFAGTVWILSGPLAGPMHIEAEATGTILGEVDHSYMPTEMFTGGDLDGDGRDELVLAHQDARLFHGPVEGTRVYTDGITFIDMSWDPAYHISFDADVDGDAIDDMAMIHYTYSGMAGMHVWFSTLSDEWPRPWAL